MTQKTQVFRRRRSRSPREIGRVDQFSGADYGNRELKKLCAQARGRATNLEIVESVHHIGEKEFFWLIFLNDLRCCSVIHAGADTRDGHHDRGGRDHRAGGCGGGGGRSGEAGDRAALRRQGGSGVAIGGGGGGSGHVAAEAAESQAAPRFCGGGRGGAGGGNRSRRRISFLIVRERSQRQVRKEVRFHPCDFFLLFVSFDPYVAVGDKLISL